MTGASAYCVDAPKGEGAGVEQMVSANKMAPTRRAQALVHVAPKTAAPSMGSAGRWPAVNLYVSAIYRLTPLRRDLQKLSVAIKNYGTRTAVRGNGWRWHGGRTLVLTRTAWHIKEITPECERDR